MGEVYRAKDTTVLVKVGVALTRRARCRLTRLARLRREAHLLASLNHVNTASIHSLESPSRARMLAGAKKDNRADLAG